MASWQPTDGFPIHAARFKGGRVHHRVRDDGNDYWMETACGKQGLSATGYPNRPPTACPTCYPGHNREGAAVTAADELREAADALKFLANTVRDTVASEPYWDSQIVPASDPDGRYAHGIENALGGVAGEFAALFTPGVVLALANWLDFHAAMDERLHALVDGTPDLDRATWGGKPHPALALARLINPKEAGRGE